MESGEFGRHKRAAIPSHRFPYEYSIPIVFSFGKMTSVPRLDSDSLHDAVSGKVAIVTGAARGIGLATAATLSKQGARVVLVDIMEDEVKQACATLGPDATYRRCDLSDWFQQVEVFNWVVQTLGRVDLVVCNAAINPEIALLQTSDEPKRQEMNTQVRYNYLADETEGPQLRAPSTRVIDINVHSVMFGMKLGIHHMKGHGGRIVIVGSAASYVPVASQPVYTASKHAVLGLMRSTAQTDEVAQSGISISLVAPWLTVTSMVEGLEAVQRPDTLKSRPEDVAAAVAYAAAAEKTNGKGYWVQGQTISEVEAAYGEVSQRLISPENRF
jgi:NAD(P)-dependent dehydrogenase (short-subunit alcohol dehydrogenase family)